MIYAPFVTEQQHAVATLKAEIDEPSFLYSLERGGALLAEQIARDAEDPCGARAGRRREDGES